MRGAGILAQPDPAILACMRRIMQEAHARFAQDPKKEENVTSEAIHGIVPLQSDGPFTLRFFSVVRK